MNVWHDVNSPRERIEWIDYILSRSPPPPIFRLRDPGDVAEEQVTGYALPETLDEVRRRRDSGVLEVRMTRPLESASEFERFGDALLALAAREDKRTFPRVEEVDSEVILAEFRSAIVEMPDVDVIGPGGRVTIARGSNWIEADLVVRRRLHPMASQWRQSEELLERINAQIADKDDMNVKVSAAFGYFELSKYEPQIWLRPAFAFELEYGFYEKSTATCIETIVESATATSEISVGEGLGAWAV